jgi:acyl-CoA synthetase (AMP-forming)/AMP-acid ligase II
MSTQPAEWGTRIVTEDCRGIPFRIYTERPRRISGLLAYAGRWCDRPYIVQGEGRVTFAELRRTVAAKAGEISRLGVRRGDRVVIMGWNSPEWAINFWACVAAGAVPVHANAWWSEGELAEALDLLDPALVLADRRGASKVPASRATGRWEAEPAGDDPSVTLAPEEVGEEEDPAIIIFTSGTSGRPKAVVLSHRAILSNLHQLLHITRRLPHQVDDATGETALHTGPLFHIGGAQALIRSVMVGDTLVMPAGRFDPGEALALIERHRISRWAAVPTMVSRLLEHPDLPGKELGCLKSVTLGGAPVHAELLEAIRQGLPSVQARIPTGYGLTENGGQATAASGADTAATPGSCGRPLPCAELRLVPQPGLPDGEVQIRAPTQMAGYYGMADSPIDAEGWLHTGDLGRLDERGQLWITGRCKELIIRGGENIAPAAVERALLSLPGVSEAAVFGIPHPDLGEEVMAVVVVPGGHTAEALQEALRARLASFAVPSRWSLRQEPLPTNHTGKVDKNELRRDALAALASREVA